MKLINILSLLLLFAAARTMAAKHDVQQNDNNHFLRNGGPTQNIKDDHKQRVLQSTTPNKDFQDDSATIATTRKIQTTKPLPIPRDFYLDPITGVAYIPARKSNNDTAGGRGTNFTNNQFILVPYGSSTQNNRRLSNLEQHRADRDQEVHTDQRLLQDTVKPTISGVTPANNTALPSIFEVRATITDNTKVTRASVAFVDAATGASSQFTLSSAGSNIWLATVRIETVGTVRMTISASDATGNTATTSTYVLSTSTYTAKAQWTNRAAPISKAAGRIVFEMLDEFGFFYSTYVCSGTLIQPPPGAPTNRSIVITAAHCVFDDVNKVFAQNALFIPQQDDGGTDFTDTDCTNDALGCLPLDYGFVSDEWTERTFPENVGADYGFYVSKLTKTNVKGKTIGVTGDIVPMKANFGPVPLGAKAYAMGYSYADDPKFMYTVDAISFDKSFLATNYWVAHSGLTGGASGGPWTLDNPATTTGALNIIATNSWGYIGLPGIGASPINTGGAACVYDAAGWTKLASITDGGLVVSCAI